MKKKDGLKSIRNQVGFAAVFEDITRGALPEETSIHKSIMTVIKIAQKEIHNREDKRWVIYTDSYSPIHSIKYNKENHSTYKN